MDVSEPKKKKRIDHSISTAANDIMVGKDLPAVEELKGQAMEDIVEAISSRNRDDWSVTQLKHWRESQFGNDSTEYIRARQRLYKKQQLKQ